MLQAIQFETVLCINVELDSSLGLKKTYNLKVCLRLECRKKWTLFLIFTQGWTAWTFTKWKKIYSTGTFYSICSGYFERSSLWNWNSETHELSASPSFFPLPPLNIQSLYSIEMIHVGHRDRTNMFFFLENTHIKYVYIQDRSCFPYVNRFACVRQLKKNTL